MKKEWLIKNSNHEIIGPLSRDQVIAMIDGDKLVAEDELLKANGFWFWMHEKDLLQRFLYDNEPQGFNPISEAEDVLTANLTNEEAGIGPRPDLFINELKNDDEMTIEHSTVPGPNDLEYPNPEDFIDMQIEDEDITLSEDATGLFEQFHRGEKVDLREVEEGQGSEGILPEGADLEFPDPSLQLDLNVDEIIPESPEILGPDESDTDDVFQAKNSNYTDPTSPQVKMTSAGDLQEIKKKVEMNAENKDSFSKVMIIVLLMIGFLFWSIFFYYKIVLNRPILSQISLPGIGTAYAQVVSPSLKKKNF